MGDTTKVDDQERIGRELAARLGWEVGDGDVYQDNNRSAWRKDRKRPGWDRMLADVEAGRIGAIIVYHGDRLIRQPDDLGQLLKLADGKGVKLASPTGTRDLGNPDDRFVLYIEAAMAMRESDNTSRRRKAQYARWAREGRVRPGGRGGRAFGFETDGLTHVPAETEIVRECVQRVLKGEADSAVIRDMAARGVQTVTGAPFNRQLITRTFTLPRFAGLMPDGVSPGAWEPVIEREEWETFRALIIARKAAHFAGATNTRKYLLSGIAECGTPGGCGRPLRVNWAGSGGGPYQLGYACRTQGCRGVFRDVRHLDLYVSQAVVRKLADPANDAVELKVTEGVAAEMQMLEQRRRETSDVLENLADHPGHRPDVLYRAIESFDRRLAGLRDRASGDVNARILRRHQGMTLAEFQASPLSVRREIVAAAFRIVVLPSGRRGPVFDPASVRLLSHGQDRGEDGNGAG